MADGSLILRVAGTDEALECEFRYFNDKRLEVEHDKLGRGVVFGVLHIPTEPSALERFLENGLYEISVAGVVFAKRCGCGCDCQTNTRLGAFGLQTRLYVHDTVTSACRCAGGVAVRVSTGGSTRVDDLCSCIGVTA